VDVKHRLTMQDGAFLLYVESAVPLFALAIKVSRFSHLGWLVAPSALRVLALVKLDTSEQCDLLTCSACCAVL
jgi:hypothetical protein